MQARLRYEVGKDQPDQDAQRDDEVGNLILDAVVQIHIRTPQIRRPAQTLSAATR